MEGRKDQGILARGDPEHEPYPLRCRKGPFQTGAPAFRVEAGRGEGEADPALLLGSEA